MFAASRRKIEKRSARRRGIHRWIRFRLEYLALRCLTTLALAVSPEIAFRTARRVGRLVYHLDLRHRRVGHENLDRVYGDAMTRAEKAELLKKVHESLALVLVELLWANRLLGRGNLDRLVDAAVVDRYAKILDHPRGVVVATAHLGNWELGPFYFSKRGYAFHSVARPLDNPLLEGYLSRLRGSSGENLIDKVGAVRSMLRALDRPRSILALPLDQNAGSGGTFVDFLGTLASTNAAPLLVAKRRRVPVVVGAVVRVAPMRFRFAVSEVLSEEEVRTLPAVELVGRVTGGIARLVRAHPEQWMWTHRRWKTRPPGENP